MKLEEINNRTKDAVNHLVEALQSGQSEVLTQYLSAMARFHNYSFGNIMLIARQKPDATNVAGLRTWNSLGRFVKRGEKGIFILAPMVGRRSTKDVATDERSEDATTEGQRTLYGFRAVYVFDRLSRDLRPGPLRARWSPPVDVLLDSGHTLPGTRSALQAHVNTGQRFHEARCFHSHLQLPDDLSPELLENSPSD